MVLSHWITKFSLPEAGEPETPTRLERRPVTSVKGDGEQRLTRHRIEKTLSHSKAIQAPWLTCVLEDLLDIDIYIYIYKEYIYMLQCVFWVCS